MSRLRIISHSSEPFRDRQEVGQLLAWELRNLPGRNLVVLGIPRGGIIVARELAQTLDAELDIVLAHKLRAPGHPELAMGSLAENGKIFLNGQVVTELGISQHYIEEETAAQLAEIKRRARLVRRIRPRVLLKGKIVIVTDDGVATGATTQAAFWAVRQERPALLVAAIPVGPEDVVRRLAEDVDEMVCLRTPSFFSAVGQFYLRFEPVDDADVLKILKEEQKRRLAKSPGKIK
ncbi:MAG: phosphoribosyltransferase family protein [Dehalococcoidia bacterium]|jgi:predicted phosphoribosyltransferase